MRPEHVVQTFEGAGARLNELLFARGMTRAQLAVGAGISRETVHTALRDRLSVKTARKLAEVLGVAPEAILEGDPSRTVEPDDPRFIRGRADQVVAGPTLPQAVLIRVKEFELEAAKRGADEPALGFIHRALLNPEAYTLHEGGYREPSPEQATRRAEALIVGLTAWLDEYLTRQQEAKRRGGGA